MSHDPLKLRAQARELRQRETPAESAMWKTLRARRFLGLKFRRQHEIDRYILDFFCEDLRLGIELDGQPHLELPVIDFDERRTEFLQERGITVVRIENDEFLINGRFVMERLRNIVQCLKRDPHP